MSNPPTTNTQRNRASIPSAAHGASVIPNPFTGEGSAFRAPTATASREENPENTPPRNLRPSPQPVQKRKQKHPKRRRNQRIRQLLPRKKSRRMIQQNPLRNHQNRLMKMKKQKYQPESADRMLRIDPSPNRRSHIPHDRLRNPIHPDRIVVRQRILHDPNRPTQKHPADRIPPAKSKINCHQQRQVDQFRPPPVLMQKRLKHQSQQTHAKHSAAVKLVNLNVPVHALVHVQSVFRTHLNEAPPKPRQSARLPFQKLPAHPST